MSCPPRKPIAALLLLSLLPVLGPALPAQSVRYSRDIRPILSQNCFRCHGPDEAERKAKLRLDVPGQAQDAPILARITSTDRKKHMPPPSSGKTLTPAQIELLRKWVEQGAKHEKHWAFVKPRLPAVPAGDGPNPDAPSPDGPNPIDRFIRARLRSAGLTPSPEADRHTLARRVYLDLIGLQPTPEEADAFVNDNSADAYEKLVDRLLASPHYGERQARRWLDLARYSDTNGYEKDRNRSIWPYRDWVIRALNADQPFDQFAIEQIAGDMLPDATPDQVIATGFHRNTMLNEEGGIDPLEFRFHAMTDRVATTGTVFLGLTVGCAQCHTHKFDPITHRDYYGMMAFLDNADEPDYFVPDPKKLKERRDNLARADKLLAALPTNWPGYAAPIEEMFKAWLVKHRKHATRWRVVRPVETSTNLPKITVEADGAMFVSGDTTKHDIYVLRFPAVDHEFRVLRLETLPDDRLPARGPGTTYYEGRKGDFFLTEFRMRAGGGPLEFAGADQSYGSNRFAKKPVTAADALDGDLQTGWSVSGGSGSRHVAHFQLEEPVPAGTAFEIEMHFGRHYASSLGKFRISVAPRARGNPAKTLGFEVDRLLAMSDAELEQEPDGAGRARLREEFLMTSVELARFTARIRELRKPARLDTTLVMRERRADNPRPTHRHHRGEYLQKRERVAPQVPGVLHPFPQGAPRNRLGFARWLVSRENPLTARVVVNRAWATFFGEGLVRTVADFGAQGETPSHPLLLDWLAVTFMDDGWSRKKLHRRIVLSRAYRQRSHVTAAHRARDPENRLLSRAPRFRLEGEALRDAALHAAGILNDGMFGKPVRPPQPAGVTEIAYGKPGWRASTGEDRNRRSLYTFQKRTAPFAFYNTFDAPSGESCVARRETSNSPLQALTLLNDPMMREIAQAFGRRLARHAGAQDLEWVAARGFRLVLTREPSEAELRDLAAFVQKQKERLQDDPKRAAEIAGSGGADAVERAAWTALARVLLGLDEAITRNEP